MYVYSLSTCSCCQLSPWQHFPRENGLFLPYPGSSTIAGRLVSPSRRRRTMTTRRRATPFNNAMSSHPTPYQLTRTHGVWLLEIVISSSTLDSRLFPRWKSIIAIHAIQQHACVPCCRPTLCGRACAGDGLFHSYPHGHPNADVNASNHPDHRTTTDSRICTSYSFPLLRRHSGLALLRSSSFTSPAPTTCATTATCSLSSGALTTSSLPAYWR